MGFGVWGLGFGVWGLGFRVVVVLRGGAVSSERGTPVTPACLRHMVQNGTGGKTGSLKEPRYRVTSLIRNSASLGPYSRALPKAVDRRETGVIGTPSVSAEAVPDGTPLDLRTATLHGCAVVPRRARIEDS